MINPFYMLIYLTLIVNIGVGFLVPVMPIYLKQFGFSSGQLSIVFFALVFARLIAQNVSGYWISKVGNYKVLFISFTLYMLTMLFYPYVNEKIIFIGFRMLEGIYQGLAIICLNDLSIELSEKKRGAKMGLYSAAFGMGFIIGPPLGGYLFQLVGKKGMFWTTSGLMLIGLISIYLGSRSYESTGKRKDAPKNFFSNFNVSYLYLFPYYSTYMIRRILFFSLQMILPLYLNEYFLLPTGKVGFYFTLSAVMSVFIMPYAGRLSDKISINKILIISILTMGFSVMFFGFANKIYFFTVLYIVESMAFSFMLPTGMKYFGDLVEKHPSRGQILGFFASIAEGCLMIVPFIIFPLYNINKMLPWVFLGTMCVLASVPFFKAINKIIPESNFCYSSDPEIVSEEE